MPPAAAPAAATPHNFRAVTLPGTDDTLQYVSTPKLAGVVKAFPDLAHKCRCRAASCASLQKSKGQKTWRPLLFNTNYLPSFLLPYGVGDLFTDLSLSVAPDRENFPNLPERILQVWAALRSPLCRLMHRFTRHRNLLRHIHHIIMPPITVRVLQGYKGAVTIDKEEATLDDFLSALSNAAALNSPGDVLLMIVKGRKLVPGSTSGALLLTSLGIVDGSPVIVAIRSPEERAAHAAVEKRAAALRQVELAAEALSSRVDLGPMDADGYQLSITNQSGFEIAIEAHDRKAFAMGALLHAKASVLLSKCAPIIIDAFPITSSSTLSPGAHELDRSL